MQFDRDKFAEVIGSRFVIKGPEGQTLDLELSEVSEIRERPHQQSFSVVFLGPESLAVDQGLYEVEHESLGTMHLFLVPIGIKDGRIILEAVFNTLRES
jgi:hypothetical protein